MSRIILFVFVSSLFPFLVPPDAAARVTIARTNYHGWLEAYVMSNGKVAVVIVPAIGRVMQFGFVGEEGVFWENHSLDGHIADGHLFVWAAKDWVNFGGDKTWPSPEAEQSEVPGR